MVPFTIEATPHSTTPADEPLRTASFAGAFVPRSSAHRMVEPGIDSTFGPRVGHEMLSSVTPGSRRELIRVSAASSGMPAVTSPTLSPELCDADPARIRKEGGEKRD